MSISNKTIDISLGVIIGYFLYKKFISPTVIKGPNSKNIINNIYNVDGRLYRLRPVICANI